MDRKKFVLLLLALVVAVGTALAARSMFAGSSAPEVEAAPVPEGPKVLLAHGVTLLTSLVSLITQQRVKSKLAMTGEITLRGKVLPVGGIKEKILAAKRAKIKEIILSESNRKDIEEINERYLNGLQFHFVKEMEEVIDLAITKQKVKFAKAL